MGLLGNPVIAGLLSGGPNAVRAREQQRLAAMLPRGQGGMMGAPGGVVRQDSGLGQGIAGLGAGLEAIGDMRKEAQAREAFEASIASLPEDQQALARLDPQGYARAASTAAFKQPEPLTTNNTGLFSVKDDSGNVVPKRMRLEDGIQAGLPEWQDPPGMKTFGSDASGYYGITQGPDGKPRAIQLVQGMGRKPDMPTYKIAETDQGVFAINSSNPQDRVPLGGAPANPQNDLAAAKLDEMKSDKTKRAVNNYEDISKTIRQAETVLSHPGREMGTGMSSFLSFVPGSEARGFAAQLETLKSQVFLPEVQKMQGMGALSNAEGQKISAAFAALDPDMPEAEFKRTLETAISDLRRAQERARSGLPQGYEDPFGAQSESSGRLNIVVTPPPPEGFQVVE